MRQDCPPLQRLASRISIQRVIDGTSAVNPLLQHTVASSSTPEPAPETWTDLRYCRTAYNVVLHA